MTTSQVFYPNCALPCTNTSNVFGKWRFANWPEKESADLESWGNKRAMQGSEGRQRLRELADKIANERDHDKFTELVKEFNQLLEAEQKPRQSASPSSGS